MSTCGAIQASCVCSIPAGRCDGRHLCDCGGSWRNDLKDPMDVLILPMPGDWETAIGLSEALTAAFGRLMNNPGT